MHNKESQILRKSFLERKFEIEKDIKESVKDCVNEIKKYNPYMLYSHILHYYKVINIMSNEENEGDKVEIKVCLKYYQMLLTCISEDEFEKCELNDKEFFEILTKLKNISNNIFQYGICLSFELDGKYTEAEQEYIRDNFLMKNVSGKRYDIFELEHYQNLFNPLKEPFEEIFGFKVESLFNGINKLKQEFIYGLDSAIESFEKYMDSNDIEEIEKDENKRKDGIGILQKMIGLESHNVNKLTNWPIEFIDIFSFKLGDNKDFLNDINFFSFMELERKMKINPFIKIDKEYYCTLIQEFLDNFDRRVLKEMCNRKSEKEEQTIRKIHTGNVEIITEKLFKNILPNSKSYIQNYYKYKGGMPENDLIVIYDRNLLIVEIKSGSYTPDLVFSNMESHLKTLEELLQKASEQSQRLYEVLKEEKIIDIYDSNNKNKKVKCSLDINDYDNIYKIIVTQENFNELEARAEKIGLIKMNEDTIVLSIDDLRVYSDYFTNQPCKFFHYLKQRVLATKNDNIKLFDELDHLGLYIEHNVYTITVDEMKSEHPKITDIWIDGYRDELNKYYAYRYLNDGEIRKPEQKLPYRIEEIINYCNSHEPANNIYFTNQILDYATKEKEMINLRIEEMIEFYKENHRGKYLCMVGDINVFIFIIYGEEGDELKTFKEDAYANMIINQIQEMSFCGIYYDRNKKIRKMVIEKLNTTKDKYDKEKCKEIAKQISDKRLRKKQMEGKKVGRNELCPCGSGKKYKKCCYNNT